MSRRNHCTRSSHALGAAALCFLAAAASSACRTSADRRFGDTGSDLEPQPKATNRHDANAARVKEPEPVVTPDAAAQPGASASRAADRSFVEEATLGGLFEVATARLALEHDLSPQLREFAERMIADHTSGNEELADVAHERGLDVPEDLDAAHQRQLDELARAEGPAFEHAYREQQIEAHDAAIELFARASRDCEEADLRAFAERTLPKLRAHRSHLESTRP